MRKDQGCVVLSSPVLFYVVKKEKSPGDQAMCLVLLEDSVFVPHLKDLQILRGISKIEYSKHTK